MYSSYGRTRSVIGWIYEHEILGLRLPVVTPVHSHWLQVGCLYIVSLLHGTQFVVCLVWLHTQRHSMGFAEDTVFVTSQFCSRHLIRERVQETLCCRSNITNDVEALNYQCHADITCFHCPVRGTKNVAEFPCDDCSYDRQPGGSGTVLLNRMTVCSAWPYMRTYIRRC